MKGFLLTLLLTGAILTWAGKVEAGDDGSVWTRKNKSGTRVTKKWRRVDRPRMGKYPQVNLDGHVIRVHGVILLVFVGPCPEGMECRHLNGEPSDNRLSNICWGSRKEQREDDRAHGRLNNGGLRGEDVGNAKQTEKQARAIVGMLMLGMSTVKIARVTGMSQPTVSAIKCGRMRKHLTTAEEREYLKRR